MSTQTGVSKKIYAAIKREIKKGKSLEQVAKSRSVSKLLKEYHNLGNLVISPAFLKKWIKHASNSKKRSASKSSPKRKSKSPKRKSKSPKRKSKSSPKRKSKSPKRASRNRHSPSLEKKRSERPSPSASAAEQRIGTIKRGNDGQMYIVKSDKNRIKRWYVLPK
jgi:hypothetical protein